MPENIFPIGCVLCFEGAKWSESSPMVSQLSVEPHFMTPIKIAKTLLYDNIGIEMK